MNSDNISLRIGKDLSRFIVSAKLDIPIDRRDLVGVLRPIEIAFTNGYLRYFTILTSANSDFVFLMALQSPRTNQQQRAVGAFPGNASLSKPNFI